jgi:3-methyladenine DNA glycosylase/8-oxoguanine DNA glycosylase
VKSDSFEAALRKAERSLKRAVPELKPLIERRRCELSRERHFEPFEALLSAIGHQQLTGKAAETILGRVKARYGDGDWPTPRAIVLARAPGLRACGLSRAKVLAVKDLAARTLDGTVPNARALHSMGDDEIVERLTTVRGVGRWTVEMMLLFRLGRLDVFPVDDYGVRKGYSQLFGLKDLVKPKALMALGEAWRPYRGVASWYLWRVLDG